MRGFDEDPLMTPLREALRPAPLDPALVQRIKAQWSSQTGFRRWGWFAWAPAALVAAALAFIFVAPPLTVPGEKSSAPTLAVEDVDSVLAAYSEGRWEGTTDAVIQRVLQKVEDLTEQLGSKADGALVDDWDLPLPRAQDSTPGRSGALPSATDVVS